MEFAGKKYIYLSKLKKDKIKKLREAEKENAEDAPVIKEEEEEKEEEEDKKEDKKEEKIDEKNMEVEEEDEKDDDKISKKLKKYSKSKKKRKNSDGSIDLALSDDANVSVCSAEFNRDMEED